MSNAIQLIKSSVAPLPPASLPVENALGCILRRPVTSRYPSPPFTTSAMDGYALRIADARRALTLPVAGVQHAGDLLPPALRPGTAVQVMTGAVIPERVDAVVPVEEVTLREGTIRLAQVPRKHQHIRFQSEEFPADAILLEEGHRITPQDTGLLVSQGISAVKVSPPPKGHLIITGSELLSPGEAYQPGKLYNSNGPMLANLMTHLGALCESSHLVGDDKDHIREILSQPIHGDFMVFSGGISMGEKDFTLQVFEEMGGRLRFQKVHQRPGHPLSFGTFQGKPCLFLPGNPVSAYVGFFIYGGLLMKYLTCGHHSWPPTAWGVLADDVQLKRGMVRFLRMRCWREQGNLLTIPLEEQGSHRITSLTRAQAIWETPNDAEGLRAGTTVPLYPLPGGIRDV